MKNLLSLPTTLTACVLLSTATAHTWLENIRLVAANGTFIGPLGFPRGYVPRGQGPDQKSVHLIPRDGPKMCGPTQQIGNQAAGFPKLEAAAGDNIALRYLENGHVTKLEPGRPARGGMVFVYGTKNPSNDDTYAGIHKVWNTDGTGGDKRGKLLATRPYDDGECYQVSGTPPSVARQSEFPKSAQDSAGSDLICQTDVRLPADAGADGDYTLYWVWDWPLLKADGSVANNESYTACSDIKMVTKSAVSSVGASKFMDNQLGNTHAIKAQLADQFLLDPSAKPALTTAPPFSMPSGSVPQQPVSAPSSSSSQSQKPIPTNGFVTITVTAPAQETVTVTDYIIIRPDKTTVAKGTATAIPPSATTTALSASVSSSSSSFASKPSSASLASSSSASDVQPTGPPTNIRPFLPTPTPSEPAKNGTTVYGRLFRRRGGRRARL